MTLPTVATACWFAKLPEGYRRVGVSRGTPRGQPAGYRTYRALNPGPWFNSVTPDEYLRLYNEQVLGKLDPKQVLDDLVALGNGWTPTLLCYEAAKDIQAGTKWCHRHIAAVWLEDKLGIEVPEVDHPELDRFRLLRERGIEAPSFTTSGQPRPPTDPLDWAAA